MGTQFADIAGHGAGSRSIPETGRCGQRQLWKTRGHFFAAAAEAMRQILVENARYKERIALDTLTRFSRMTIVPNLSPLVTTTDQARTNRGHASGP